MTKPRLTMIHVDGAVYVRAHHWGPLGYSSKTFATAGEADAWIRSKGGAA